MLILIRGTIIITVSLFIWHFIVVGFNLPSYILPSPLLVLIALKEHLGLILQQSIPTIIEAGVGFILSLLFGGFWALVLVYFRPLRLWFLPLLLASQALPVFAVAPLFVIWLGYGVASKIAVTCLMLFFPITSSFYDGLSHTPDRFLDLAKTMNATRWQFLWRIRVPVALPALGKGLKIAAVFAPMGAVIGEWVGASRGLGFLILNANSRMQIDLMFAALLILVILALVFYYSVDFLLTRLISSRFL